MQVAFTILQILCYSLVIVMQIKLIVVVVATVPTKIPLLPCGRKISFPANFYSLKGRKFHFSSRAAALISRVSGLRR